MMIYSLPKKPTSEILIILRVNTMLSEYFYAFFSDYVKKLSAYAWILTNGGDEMENKLYISSPINAILEGFHRDDITIGSLREKGDFGIGTFNHLDGEMIAMDGSFMRLDFDGNARPAESDWKTPYAVMCHFKPTLTERIDALMDFGKFSEYLKRMLPSDNMFYAICMTGKFHSVDTRSVPKTEKNLPLAEVTPHQKVRHFKNIEGRLVGFYTPPFVPSVSVPGYHFHFINSDFSEGGHLLSCAPESLEIRMQVFFSLELTLPKTLDYLTASFVRDARRDLEKAER
jgi:acetolactate decarboxylase